MIYLTDTFHIALIVSTFLCSVVAGFLFAYAIVIMPGIKNLNDREFIRAFQVTDQIIQNNQPIFLLVWIGSAIAIIVTAFLGFKPLSGFDFVLLFLATLAYVFGVQAPTIAINLPLNNTLQTHNIDAMSDTDLKLARQEFESHWNTANLIRTAIASGVSILLIILVYRL